MIQKEIKVGLNINLLFYQTTKIQMSTKRDNESMAEFYKNVFRLRQEKKKNNKIFSKNIDDESPILSYVQNTETCYKEKI